MKIRKRDVGRAVTVHWDDVGNRDGVLVEADSDSRYVKVFEFRGELHTIDPSQIVAMREHIKAS